MSDPTRLTWRHELKFLITPAERSLMAARLGGLLQHDSHAENGVYLIRSLYFDDYWDSAYEEKMNGTLERKKYRVRVYNYADKVIKLERKRKFDQYICKESASLTRGEFEGILAGEYDFLLKSEQPLCREFYVECRCHGMRPRVIVDYDREPWVFPAGDVRITFDSSIRCAVGSFDIFDPALPCLSVLEPGALVLEVKFTQFLPQFIKDVLPPRRADNQAVSKYTLCYEKSAYLRGEACWTSPEPVHGPQAAPLGEFAAPRFDKECEKV